VSFDVLVAVPSAPLLLPAVSPAQPPGIAGQVAALRDAVDRALAPVADVDSVILLAAGDEALVHDANRATLASYGHPAVTTELAHDEELLSAVASRGQIPRVRDDRLDGDLAVLATLVTAVRPDVSLLSVTVPYAAGAAALGASAAGLTGAAATTDRKVAVVAAADLAATLDTSSPGYLVEGAATWDAAVVAAVREGDVEAMAALGPAEATRVQARGWAPLAVLLTVGHRLQHRFAEVTYLAPRGVGQLVAR
jgi:hypothetical protein